jgi:ferritin-like metal-binding protein YciE
MGLFSKDIQSMDDLYMHTLEDIYYAEQQIEKALPKMAEKTSSATLKTAFETHLQETRGQIERLEQVFALLNKDPKGVTCPAIDGIIKETNEISSEISDDRVLDAALAAAAQAVEHYEMTRYGTLIAWSKELGHTSCADLLQETLDEEEATDRKLTEIATSRLNPAA